MIKFEELDFPVEKIFFTGCTHYGHANICSATTKWKSGYRDFDSIEQMNTTIVNGINAKVPSDGLLIHLGDWSFGGSTNVNKFRDELACKVILLRGNHDHNVIANNNWIKFADILHLSVENFKFVACHYPIIHWHNQSKGAYMLHSHLHGQEDSILKEVHNNQRCLDVGLDNYFKIFGSYAPFSISEIESLIPNNSLIDRHSNEES